MPSPEQRFFPKSKKDLIKKTAIVAGIGFATAIGAKAIELYVRNNREHVNGLLDVAQEIEKAESLPFIHQNNVELSESDLQIKGMQIHAFGDSRAKVNVNAGKYGMPEKWVDEGAFPDELMKLFHYAGFPKVLVVSHAKEGDSSDETLQKMGDIQTDLVENVDEPIAILKKVSGNDYRGLFSRKRLLTLATVYFPLLSRTDLFRHEFHIITNRLKDNKVEMMKKEKEFHEQRVEKGKPGIVADIEVTASKYNYTDPYIPIYGLPENGKEDKRVWKLRSTASTTRAGKILAGGEAIADREALKVISQQLPLDIRGFPIIVVPCHKIDRRDDYDGSYHYSQKGQRRIAETIAKKIIIKSEEGLAESLYDRVQRMMKKGEVISAGGL